MPHAMLRPSFKDSTIKALAYNPQDREAAAGQVVEAFGGRCCPTTSRLAI